MRDHVDDPDKTSAGSLRLRAHLGALETSSAGNLRLRARLQDPKKALPRGLR